MGKQGPCCHCGVTSTPLWRNGPPDKPVLCNACGSRWRTKGTLANYTPLHARAETGELEDYRLSRVRNIPIKNKETKVFKRKLNQNNAEVKRLVHANRGLHLGMDEDNSNRSSSGSAMSNSDSCVQFGSGDMSDLTGPSQSIVWDSTIPSRKRTCVNRPTTSSSALERLTRDLHTILKEQQSSQHSGSCEEELLFESDAPMVSVEIGHGSVLIRHPSYVAKEEESVASSFPVDKKPDKANEAYSHLDALSAHCNNKGANILSPGTEKCRKVQGLGMQHDQIKRENTPREMLQVLGNPKSPLCCIDLGDVLNFDVFQQYLTIEERRHLLKYLHPIDTAEQPDSLRDMFHNALFKENLSSYQKLLAEGVLDLSFLAPNAEDCQTLRRLALGGFTKSKWVEQYNQLKEIKYRSCNESSVVQEDSKMVASGYSTNVKKSRDLPFQKFPAAKPTMKSPKRVTKGIYEHNELMDVNENCFKPKGLFMSPPPPANNNSLVSNSFHYMDESYDQDMLLEVPSNGSFPEAELLLPSSSFGTQASASSSTIYPQLVPPR